MTGLGQRCYPCFNEETAQRMGVAFDNAPLQPIELSGSDGVVHRFEIRSMLCPTGHELIAEEVPSREDRGGYRFAILGDFEADAWQLFQRLYVKMQRELNERHIEYSEYGWRLTDRDRVIGRIDSDPDPDAEDGLPLLVVDGKALKWNDVGRMLMQYEGFTLHLQVEDSIEVVGGPLLESHDGDDDEKR